MMTIAATTGEIRPYGSHAKRRRRRRGRDLPSAATAASCGTATSAPRFIELLRRVQGVRDVRARRRSGLIDGELAGQDLGQHGAEDIPVLDVHPVLRSGDEPAAEGGAFVDLGGVQE